MTKLFHPRNKHQTGYDFTILTEKHPPLQPFLINRFNKVTIDFANPKAVKALNTALLVTHYGITEWTFPDKNLCPPIPGRVDYIHYLADILPNKSKATILDIGTGASCIYPLLGVAEYDWNFVGTDSDKGSLKNAQKIITGNNLEHKITLRYQPEKKHILIGVLNKTDVFTATMCNPPFYSTMKEAVLANQRKSRNLKTVEVRNFSGSANELYYLGGEKAFLHTYLYESSKYPKASNWFTSLMSNKNNVATLKTSAKKLGVSEFKIIPMQQGNKITRIVCWRF